jgi:hypothetical protein
MSARIHADPGLFGSASGLNETPIELNSALSRNSVTDPWSSLIEMKSVQSLDAIGFPSPPQKSLSNWTWISVGLHL